MNAVSRECPFSNESDFQTELLRVAKRFGWLAYHPRFSIDSEPGFPDTTMVKGERLIFAELKGPRGVASDEQRNWLARLGQVKVVEPYLWWPTDWDAVLEILARRTLPGHGR